MDQLFQELFHNNNIHPYSFQIKSADLISQRKNIILCAPTGAGKTWAALLGFLHAKRNNQPFADRVIYALPMRTLANNLYHSTIEKCKNIFQVSTNAQEYHENPDSLCITIQTGENKTDPFLQGDIIFTTIDQLLSNYLNIPYSLPPKLSNINAGTLIGSLVVLDEIHLLDPKRSLATVMEMVNRLGLCTQFLLMTATLSSQAIKIIQEHINAEIITVAKDELAQIPSQQNKRRRYRWVNSPLTAEHVLAIHKERSIVVCNTVSRAQEIYSQLKEAVPSGCKLFLLHSRFFKKDRKKTEMALAEYFGPDSQQDNCILVTTQAVEVGVDISADNLHTELCPANSLIQRAGRCARYAAPRNVGTVWVYNLQQNKAGLYKLGPYRESYLADIINHTRNAISELDNSIIDFYDELNLVDNVHQNCEQTVLTNIKVNISMRKRDVDKVINYYDRSKISELIRDIDSINILLTANPEGIEMSKLPELFSIPKSSLFALTKAIGNSSEAAWAAKIPIIDEDNEIENQIHWKVANKVEELLQSRWLVAISPSAAGYSEEVGLQLGKPGLAPVLEGFEPSIWIPFSYSYETYYQHVRKVIVQTRRDYAKYKVGCRLLEKQLQLPDKFIDNITEIALSLHDVGKLLKQWQNPVRLWQETFYSQYITDKDSPLAHSTFCPANGDLVRTNNKQFRRENHAAEGAFAVANAIWLYLTETLGDNETTYQVFRVILTAIARHHNGHTRKLAKNITFIPNAERWVNEGIGLLGNPFQIEQLNVPITGDCENFEQLLIDADKDEQWLLLYWLVVRRLRLADQNSLKNGGDGYD